MVSFADNIANFSANVSAGFDNQILAQANRINALQQGGTNAANGAGAADAGGGAALVSQAFGLDGGPPQPGLIKQALQEIMKNPQLMKMLPPQIQEKVQGMMSKVGCCNCSGG